MIKGLLEKLRVAQLEEKVRNIKKLSKWKMWRRGSRKRRWEEKEGRDEERRKSKRCEYNMKSWIKRTCFQKK